jgi:hypothetical protein
VIWVTYWHIGHVKACLKKAEIALYSGQLQQAGRKDERRASNYECVVLTYTPPNAHEPQASLSRQFGRSVYGMDYRRCTGVILAETYLKIPSGSK